jgi:membrane protein implicated in regulation of membrane protease activity
MESLIELFSPALVWFIIGLILVILEFIIPGLITIFFGIGAWIVSSLCLIFNISLNLQLFIFIICSILALIFLRKWFKKLFEGRWAANSDNIGELEEFLGKNAVVTLEITPNREGKVEFRGSSWKAKANEIITEGTTVEIIGKSNITLLVKSL